MDICSQDGSVFWQEFEEGLTGCIPEESMEDQANEITRMQHSIAILDLDAVFGGSATDLEDEDEEPAPTKTSTGGSANGAESSRSTKAILRSLLPEDLSDQIDKFQDELPADFHEESQRTFARSFSEANVEWRHMWKASEELRRLGTYVPKKLQKADRSCDWFWDNGRPSDTKSFPSVQVVDKNEPSLAWQPPPRRNPDLAFNCTPSKLRTMELADHASVEVVEVVEVGSESVDEEVVEEADTVPEVVEQSDTVPEEVVEQSDTVPEEVVEEADMVSRLDTAAWKDLSASLRALAPFLGLEISFQPKIGRDVGEMNKGIFPLTTLF